MYGKIKRNFIKIFNKLGVFSNSLQNTFYNTPYDFSNQNITTFSLKITLVILSTLIILFILSNKSFAFDLLDSQNNFANINIATLEDFKEQLPQDFDFSDWNALDLDNAHICIFKDTYSSNYGTYSGYCFLKSTNNDLYIYNDTYALNCDKYDSTHSYYLLSNSILYTLGTNGRQNNWRNEKTIVNNASLDYSHATYINFTYDNTLYINNIDHIYYVDSEGNQTDILALSNQDPQEPFEDPIEENEESTSVDLSFTNNLLFYLCFIMTLNTLYTMIRNIFSKEW